MKRQAGFTLIELVMVIVILGILSAFALPRFADLGQEARAAAIEGAAGSIRSAASIAHADFLVGGDNAATTVTLEGTVIQMINGYPEASDINTGGILEAAQIAAADFTIVNTDAGTAVGDEIVIQAIGATTPANCQITYEAPAANTAPTITVDVTDC